MLNCSMWYMFYFENVVLLIAVHLEHPSLSQLEQINTILFHFVFILYVENFPRPDLSLQKMLINRNFPFRLDMMFCLECYH